MTTVPGQCTLPAGIQEANEREGPGTGVTFAGEVAGEAILRRNRCWGRLRAAGSLPSTPVVHLTGLATGPPQVQVRAKDAAGNVEAEAAIHAWTME